MNYKSVIGLEVHVELKTKSKMFCGCPADYFGKEPNTHTCPVCLGLPGALPVPNKKAIEWCIMIGLSLNCDIAKSSKFDRKNYFYPDLPKGYQISQYDEPFAFNGNMTLSNGKEIRIRRVHMEEDTGKLVHQDGSSLIDFNRSGVPLVEIVTEPDFENAKQVAEYLKNLQQIVRYLMVSDADMEKGEMRLEPNISLKKESEKNLPSYKVEVKNINSFRFVEKAIEYEIKRQSESLDKGVTPVQETRGYDENKNATVSQRVKEEASDYRYFPEPDIPSFTFSEEYIAGIECVMPEMPLEKLNRFIEIYRLSPYDAEILVRERKLAEYFDEAVTIGFHHEVGKKQIANYIINKKIDIEKILPDDLIKEIIESKKTDVINESELSEIINKVISENQKAVDDYKNGKTNSIMFLVGQVMRISQKKLDAKKVKDHIEKMLQ